MTDVPDQQPDSSDLPEGLPEDADDATDTATDPDSTHGSDVTDAAGAPEPTD